MKFHHFGFLISWETSIGKIQCWSTLFLKNKNRNKHLNYFSEFWESLFVISITPYSCFFFLYLSIVHFLFLHFKWSMWELQLAVSVPFAVVIVILIILSFSLFYYISVPLLWIEHLMNKIVGISGPKERYINIFILVKFKTRLIASKNYGVERIGV